MKRAARWRRAKAMLALEVKSVSKRFMVSAGEDEKTPARNWGEKLARTVFPQRKVKCAVDDVSLEVERGSIFGIVGPNGGGKSTLIRMMSTLLYPDSGTVKVFGHDVVKRQYEVQKLINRVSVDAAFFKKLSPYENLLYAARLYGVPDKAAIKRSREIMDKLGFEGGRLTDCLQELSRGMQQKVAIARALLTSPILLLLDEPTTGLDPKSKRDVQDYIEEIHKTHDATVVLTSHDMSEMEKLCPRIAIMHKGRFIAVDSADGLKKLAQVKANGSLHTDGNGEVTLEDAFIALTGEEWKTAEEEE
jgi:ABC-2 type transport system ATP-binding protein